MLLLKEVSKKYKSGVHALHEINLEVKPGEFVYIIGPTGSGKSTLIKLLDGEEKPTKGEVLVSGFNVGKLRHAKVPFYRRHIGVVFQDFKLLESKTVFENIAFALEVVNKPTSEIRVRVREVLRLVGLSDKTNAFPRELSGGQQQRVAIARALIHKPKVIFADEPTGNLDEESSKEVLRLLLELNEDLGNTLILVTHDPSISKQAERVIHMKDGTVSK